MKHGYEAPEKLDDLQLSLKTMLDAWTKARNDGAPEDRIDLLYQYIAQLQYLMTPSEPAAPTSPEQPQEQAAPVPPQEVPPGMLQ